MFKSSVTFILLAGLVCGCETSAPPRPTPPGLKAGQQPEALMRLGDDMGRQGDEAGAINLYRSASDLSPKAPLPLIKMGDAYTNLSDPQRAEQAYRGALAFAPNDLDANRGLAIALLAQNKPDEALVLLRKLDDGHADARLLRSEGAALDLLGQSQEAQTIYRRGLALDPTNAGLHGNLALSMAINNDNSGALSELRAAVGSPKPDPRQEANAVLVLALLGRTQEARSRGAQSIGVAPTNALLERVERARQASPTNKAWALGVLTSTSPTTGPARPTDLPPVSVANRPPVPQSAPVTAPPPTAKTPAPAKP